MGAKTSFDPTNADFMKSKFGNTRVDPFGGFLQYIVAASRLISGDITSSVTGKTQKLGKSFNAPTRKDIMIRFGENKLSPLASFADMLATGKDFEGKPINIPNELRDRFTPMVINDMIELYKEDPNLFPGGIVGKAAIAAGSLTGMGVQTYKPSDKQLGGLKLRLGR